MSVLVVALASCTWPVDARELPGTYVMNRGRAAETLILEPEGRYRHIYAVPNAPVVREGGSWRFARVKHEMVVTFAGYLPRWRNETEASTLQRKRGS